MNLNITINNKIFAVPKVFVKQFSAEFWLGLIASVMAVIATAYAYANNWIIAYGDAESHLNIAKRVVDSLTPGLAQLGGIWLPLPHLLLAPLVYFDFLWQTGLAGSIISGIAFVISAIFLFKLTRLILRDATVAFIAALVFIFNPNILYLQATPMTELSLLVFFILSIYYFVKFIYQRDDLNSFIRAAFYGFLASLCRYDGWFLVIIEAGIVAIIYSPLQIHWQKFWHLKSLTDLKNSLTLKGLGIKNSLKELDGRLVLFCTLAFFGVLLWLGWDGLILGDPLYFTHSEFSAKSQQLGWEAKGQLPAIHNLWLSFAYYFITALSNIGVLVFFVALVGLILFLLNQRQVHRFLIVWLLLTPFIFYLVTLYIGQSIIFIPHLTPPTFEWTLFNVRYGAMMVPVAAIFFAYTFSRAKSLGRGLLIGLLLVQFCLYGVGYSKVISLDDGLNGLSTAKRPDAERWLKQNYDHGLVLLDDFSRLISIIRSGIPMANVIYIGNKPYWEESLVAPEKYATWIVVQKNDAVWKDIYENPALQGRLYKYFTKVYTSPEILIFRRTADLPASFNNN